MPSSSDLTDFFCQDTYSVTPDILLLPDGPKSGQRIKVSDGKIVEICPAKAAQGETENNLELPGYALTPGFIDAHTHAGQTFGKALIGGEPAQIWKRIWNPMEANMGAEEAYVSAKWMFLESLRGGFTCLVNFSMNDEAKNAAVHKAAEETGIKLLSSIGLDQRGKDASGMDTVRSVADLLPEIRAFKNQCAKSSGVFPSICCTSFYNSDDDYLIALSEACKQSDVKLQIHSNEHFPEVHECVTRFGLRPIEYLETLGVLGEHLLLHHTTLVSNREIELLALSRTPISYNPIASMWKGNAVAPALAFSERGVVFGIGSDTTSADGLKNLSAAESCQRIKHGMPIDDFSCGAGWTWTNAATHGSAQAAGLADKTGQLAVGLDADFLLFDMVRPECLPSHDFEWELVRYYNRDQIEAVVIAGKPVLLSGQPVGWDASRFIKNSMEMASVISHAPGIERVHGPSGLHRPNKVISA